MATGDFWNVDDPLKPWGLFDPEAILDFPISIADWLVDMDSTYASHSIITAAPLECDDSAHSAGIITVRMSLVVTPVYTSGVKYPFTLRLVCADGQQDDRTFWLKVKAR